MRTVACLSICLLLCGQGWAESLPDFNKLVLAIGRAENSVEHPYGIMARYKHTTPRQACLNTVSRAYKLWAKTPSRHRKPYLAFLAERYAPTRGIGLRPAERALNRFWLKNVQFYYNKGV